jgi:hypothetical protein
VNKESLIRIFLFPPRDLAIVNRFQALSQPLENLSFLVSPLVDAKLLQPQSFRFQKLALQPPEGASPGGVAYRGKLQRGAGTAGQHFPQSSSILLQTSTFELFHLGSKLRNNRSDGKQALLFLALDTLPKAHHGLQWIAKLHGYHPGKA